MTYSFSFALARVKGDHLRGDEPEYLLEARSLRQDGDLLLQDEFRNPKDAYPLPMTFKLEGRPSFVADFMPGHPMLLIIPDHLGGRDVALFFAALVWSGALLLLFFYLRIHAGDWPASIATLLAAFAVPMSWHAASLWSEIMAMAALSGLLLISSLDLPGRRPAIAAATLLAVLPWLHQKYVVLGLGVIGAFCLLKQWRKHLPLLAASFVVGTFGSIWLAILLHGRPNFTYFYPPGPEDPARPVMWLLHWASWLFDRTQGIVPVAPVWLVAFGGVLIALRRERYRQPVSVLALATLPFLAVYMATWGFQEGEFPVGRESIPAVPLLAFLLVVALREVKGIVARGIIALSALASILVAFQPLVSASIDGVYNNAGEAKVLKALSTTILRWPDLFPPISTAEEWRFEVLLAHIAILIATVAFFTWSGRSRDQPLSYTARKGPQLIRSPSNVE